MVKAYLKLFRWPNLLISALVILALRFLVLEKTLDALLIDNYQKLSIGELLLLILSIVLIAAGGNILNDVLDVEADKVNKPENRIIGTQVSEGRGNQVYLITTALGIAIGVFLAIRLGNFQYAILHLIAAGLLYTYSTYLKHLPVVGNLVVAFLSALVPITYYIFEVTPFYKTNVSARVYLGPDALELDVVNPINILMMFTLFLAGFAFVLSWVRELIKDIEDVEGDAIAQSKTMPIAVGLGWSKALAVLLIVSAIAGIWISLDQIGYRPFFKYYLTMGVGLPLAFMLQQILKAKTQKDYHLISTYLKIIMLLGIGTCVVFYLIF